MPGGRSKGNNLPHPEHDSPIIGIMKGEKETNTLRKNLLSWVLAETPVKSVSATARPVQGSYQLTQSVGRETGSELPSGGKC